MRMHRLFLVWFRLLSGHFLGQLLTRLTVCSLCIMSICNLSYFPFCFEGWILVLIVAVPGHCLPFTFTDLLFQLWPRAG